MSQVGIHKRLPQSTLSVVVRPTRSSFFPALILIALTVTRLICNGSGANILNIISSLL
jgi:hypothetical protein